MAAIGRNRLKIPRTEPSKSSGSAIENRALGLTETCAIGWGSPIHAGCLRLGIRRRQRVEISRRQGLQHLQVHRLVLLSLALAHHGLAQEIQHRGITIFAKLRHPFHRLLRPRTDDELLRHHLQIFANGVVEHRVARAAENAAGLRPKAQKTPAPRRRR